MEDKKGTARTRANNKYSAKTYDRLNILVKKGRREELKTIADGQGLSLNAFVLSAIDEKIDRLNHSPHLDLDNLLN